MSERPKNTWESFFTRQWHALCKKHGLTQVDFMKRAGMTRSHVNRLWHGQYAPTNDDLRKIANVACKTLTERAELVQARLLDYCDAKDRRLIRISVQNAPDGQMNFATLPPEVRESLVYFAEQTVENPHIATSLVELAKALEVRKKR